MCDDGDDADDGGGDPHLGDPHLDRTRPAGEHVVAAIRGYGGARRAWAAPALGALLRVRTSGRRVTVRPLGGFDTAEVTERVPGGFVRALCGGSQGLLRGYVLGDWASDDLYQVLSVLFGLERRARLAVLPALPASLTLAAVRVARKPRDYERIAVHYDLPAELFEATLHPTLAYSAARTRTSPDDPDRAYRETYTAVLDRLLARVPRPARAGGPPDRPVVLDLGAGWGAFAEHALRTSDAAVCAVTCSARQARHLTTRLGEYGPGRLSVVHADFTRTSALPERADAVVMIESIEHLHPLDRGPFLRALRGRYPAAPLFLQFTAVAGWTRPRRAGRATASTSLIFPGPGDFPATAEIVLLARRAGYRVTAATDLSAEYHGTVLRWAARFRAAAPDLRRHHGAELVLAWEFYLVGLAAALATRTVTSRQLFLDPVAP